MWRGCLVQPSTRTLYVRVTCTPRNTGHPLFTGCRRCIHLFFLLLLLHRRFLVRISRFESIELINFFFFLRNTWNDRYTLYINIRRKWNSHFPFLVEHFSEIAIYFHLNVLAVKFYGIINNAYKGNVYANPHCGFYSKHKIVIMYALVSSF